jgi:leucyl/phenylalanyl-tRNA--protein transferase
MRSPQITWISSDDPPDAFPRIDNAFDIPDGLLAAGGDLSPERLLYAYSHGIFPWYNEGQPILWWSPDPRCVIRPDQLHISRRLRRVLKRSEFEIGFNAAFADVISHCAADRPGQDGTWITTEMDAAYRQLHAMGWAHSVEVWRAEQLVGGLYGIAIGDVFFGESMFSAETDASKAAMLALCSILSANGFVLLDCQVESPHLLSLGATLMPRREFAAVLESACAETRRFSELPPERLKIKEFRR